MRTSASRDNFASLMVAVVLPTLQSLITGFFVFLFSWTLASVAWQYASYNGLNFIGTPLLFSFSLGIGVAFLMWLNLRSRWHSALEQLLNIDLNNDGYIGDPAEQYEEGDEIDVEPVPLEETKNVKVYVHEDNSTKIFDLPIDQDKLVKVAKLLLQRKVFTYADFSGPDKLLLRHEFEAVRKEFVSRGILFRGQEKNATATLTRAGAATMRAIIDKGGSIPG